MDTKDARGSTPSRSPSVETTDRIADDRACGPTLAHEVSARFREARAGAHDAPPDLWERDRTAAGRPERLDPPCDPTRARFWDLLRIDPAVHNEGRTQRQSHGGWRQLDLRPTEVQVDALRRRGFVVRESPRDAVGRLSVRSFGDAFHLLHSDDLPVYVAPDPLLHAWHCSFDTALAHLERTDLVRLLDGVLSGMLGAARRRLEREPPSSPLPLLPPPAPESFPEVGTTATATAAGAAEEEDHGLRKPTTTTADAPMHPAARDALRDAVVYCWVARQLLLGGPPDAADPLWRWAGTEARREADALLGAATAGRAATVTLMGRDDVELDFSRFRPRGHYAGHPTLERYFRAVMWCGHVDVPLCGRGATPRTAAAALALVALLRESDAWDRWAALDATLRALVGASDGVDARALRAFAESHPVSSDVFAGRRSVSADPLCDEMARDPDLPTNAIDADLRVADPRGPPTKTFALLGRRFVLDAWALSQTVYDAVDRADGDDHGDDHVSDAGRDKVPRGMPTCLDAAYAVLASDAAVPALADGARASGHRYLHQLDALRAAADALPASRWEESLYMRWLGLLRELSGAPPEGAPRLMGTAAWAARDLEAQMASWAQLRHDTLLYAKQGVSAITLLCEYPAGWVDARPAFWERFARMADAAADVMRDVTLAVRPAGAVDDGGGDDAVHRDVRCDGCGMTPIRGRRVRCAQCDDFDLCGRCHASALADPHGLVARLTDATKRVLRAARSALSATPPANDDDDDDDGGHRASHAMYEVSPDPDGGGGGGAGASAGIEVFYRDFAARLRRLRDIATRELADAPLDAAQERFLRRLVVMESRGSGSPSYTGWYMRMFYGGRDEACCPRYEVADVHSKTADDLGPGGVLCEATGPVDLMVACVERDDHGRGGATMYVGPVSSHYEWVAPEGERPADDEWARRVWAATSPPTGPKAAPSAPLPQRRELYRQYRA